MNIERLRATNVVLPGGQNTPRLTDALVAFDDEWRWQCQASEMHLSVREGSEVSLMVVVRRANSVCLICKEIEDEAPGFVSLKAQPHNDTWHRVEMQDVTVFYPEKYFIPLEEARSALAEFIGSRRRSGALDWELLEPATLRYEYF